MAKRTRKSSFSHNGDQSNIENSWSDDDRLNSNNRLHLMKGPVNGCDLDDVSLQPNTRNDIIRMIFDLPKEIVFYNDFSCAVAGALAMHGRMYPTNRHICYYSNLFGTERKIIIGYELITSITKTTARMIQAAICIETSDSNKYCFTSFWGNHRDECYELIVQLSNLRNGNNQSSESDLDNNDIIARSTCSTDSSVLSNDSVASISSCSSASRKSLAMESSTTSNSNNSPTTSSLHDNQQSETSEDEEEQDLSLDPEDALEKEVSMDLQDKGTRQMTQILEKDLEVSVEGFLRLFIDDHANHSLEEFNRRLKASEMVCEKWKTYPKIGKSRSMRFRIPVDAPIGPKTSRVHVNWKERFDHVTVIETSTRLEDIPYGDYFSVEDKWTIHSLTPERCRLRIEIEVVFSQSTIWKGKIESKAKAGCTAKFIQWVEYAQQSISQSLELTTSVNLTTPSLLKTRKTKDMGSSTFEKPVVRVSSVPHMNGMMNNGLLWMVIVLLLFLNLLLVRQLHNTKKYEESIEMLSKELQFLKQTMNDHCVK